MEGDTGGQVGYRWEGDTGGQVPPNSCLFRGLYYRWDMKVDQVDQVGYEGGSGDPLHFDPGVLSGLLS